MPSLTLTMIVRDEEALLPGCLASVQGAVDEIVVVDTGSRDCTRRIAEQAGARVVDFTWCDDFAAARNEALCHARSHWVLALDADERLGPRSGRALRAALAGARFDCGMLRLHDASRVDAPLESVIAGTDRAAEVQLVPRLLRRTDGLAYVDAIHENVLPWLRRRGMKVAGVDVDVVHLGATRDVVDAKGKTERNIRLLRSRVERDPRDVAAHGYLAHDLMRAGDVEGAFTVAERGWRAAVDGAESFASIHRVATAYAHLLVGRGSYAQARDVAVRAAAAEGENPDFTFFVAYAYESEAATDPSRRAELLGRAREGYRACLALGPKVFAQCFVVGARSWYGATRLGIVELQLGRPGAAEQAFDAALGARPGYRPALLGQAEARLDGGRPVEAIARVEPLLDETPDGWTLAASAALSLGREADARLFAMRAMQAVRAGFVGGHRRTRLQRIAESLGEDGRGGSLMTMAGHR